MIRKRILIFSLAGFQFVGGAEVAVKEISDRLPQYEFEIISADIKSFWSKYFYPLWAYRLAVRQHRIKNYDLIWAIMANQAGMAGALFKWQFPQVPFLLTLQEGDDLNSLRYRLRLIFPRLFRVFQGADRITAISDYLARWARVMGAKCPIDVVPNGVDSDSFQVLGSRFQGRKEKIVITTSRLVKKNGIDTLIEAMRFLPDNVRLQILGGGIEGENLKLKTKSYNLETRVEFISHVPPNEVAGYLAQADVFVRPSRSEGLGNSFLEAMAAGVPIVGTPVGGIPDFLYGEQSRTINQKQTGWFCQVDNPKSVAEKVKYIFDPANRGKVDQVIANAKKLVHEKYGWDLIAKSMAQIMDNLLTVDK